MLLRTFLFVLTVVGASISHCNADLSRLSKATGRKFENTCVQLANFQDANGVKVCVFTSVLGNLSADALPFNQEISKTLKRKTLEFLSSHGFGGYASAKIRIEDHKDLRSGRHCYRVKLARDSEFEMSSASDYTNLYFDKSINLFQSTFYQNGIAQSVETAFRKDMQELEKLHNLSDETIQKEGANR